jgi:hypothetical protein
MITNPVRRVQCHVCLTHQTSSDCINAMSFTNVNFRLVETMSDSRTEVKQVVIQFLLCGCRVVEIEEYISPQRVLEIQLSHNSRVLQDTQNGSRGSAAHDGPKVQRRNCHRSTAQCHC